MHKEFQTHVLNAEGMLKAREISDIFDTLLTQLELLALPPQQAGESAPMTREFAICKTKLEEACFFAKKSMASQFQNLEK